MNEIKVVAIQTSPNKGEPMVPQVSQRVLKDKGIAGDRYAEGSGAYSKSSRVNVPPELNQERTVIRDVTIISTDAISEANAGYTTNFSFEDTRRNVLVEGKRDLRELIGIIFTIGGVAMLGIEACDPCDRPSKLSGKPGFNETFQGRGGLRARVLEDGEIKVGDILQVKQRD